MSVKGGKSWLPNWVYKSCFILHAVKLRQPCRDVGVPCEERITAQDFCQAKDESNAGVMPKRRADQLPRRRTKGLTQHSTASGLYFFELFHASVV